MSFKEYLKEVLEQKSGREMLKDISNFEMDWGFELSNDKRVRDYGNLQREELQKKIDDLTEKIWKGEVTDVTIDELKDVVVNINKKFLGYYTYLSVPYRPIKLFDEIKKIWPVNGSKAEQLMKNTKVNSFAIKKAGSKNEFLFLPKAIRGEIVWRTVDDEKRMMPFRAPLPLLFKYVKQVELKDEDFEIVSSKIGKNY